MSLNKVEMTDHSWPPIFLLRYHVFLHDLNYIQCLSGKNIYNTNKLNTCNWINCNINSIQCIHNVDMDIEDYVYIDGIRWNEIICIEVSLFGFCKNEWNGVTHNKIH